MTATFYGAYYYYPRKLCTGSALWVLHGWCRVKCWRFVAGMWCASIGSSAWLTAGCHKERLTMKYCVSQFAHTAEEDRPNPVSNEWCVSIAVRLKLLSTGFQLSRSKYGMLYTKKMNSIRQPMSARRLDRSKGPLCLR